VLQVLVIAAGAIVPVMYFLGAIFAALWVIGIAMGRRLDAMPWHGRRSAGLRPSTAGLRPRAAGAAPACGRRGVPPEHPARRACRLSVTKSASVRTVTAG
jgi:hypothetical protein